MTEATAGQDFIRQIIADDLKSGRHDAVVTRFPPEPNGFLHIGHAKSICLNFQVTQENPGHTFLRFDDTNPGRERQEFADAIMDDVRWLGYDWGDRLTHASDYFDRLYEAAERLIQSGYAYVDSRSAEAIRETRGTLTEPGTDSPHRERSVDENLDLFRRMRAGEFADGTHVLRAKIDMASPNINLRDPTLYRIRKQDHQRTGDKWPIYPMYDFAHTLSDAFEGITHSLCTLEFEDHRPLYDWFLDKVAPPNRPRQIEFSRLALAFTITSKRKLTELIDKGIVEGWDDPRLLTIAGMRRRGYPAAAIRDLCRQVGVTKKDALIEMGVLENCVRDVLNPVTPRVMGVLRPLKVVLTNYPDDQVEQVVAQNHPGDTSMGTRELPFCRELYIEQEDFMEDAPKKFFRLKPGGEVRLRYACIIRCDEVIHDENGNIVELHCSMDPDSRSGGPTSDRKVKGTIHWVSARHAVKATVQLYDRLFRNARPGSGGSDYHQDLNENSLEIIDNARLEPGLANAAPEQRFQFERVGYFMLDAGRPGVFNRIVTLRDSWKKIEQQQLGPNK